MSGSANARLLVTLALVATCGHVLLRGGQRAPPPDQQAPAPTFRSSAEAVTVSAIVTDADGNPVAGLTQDDFEILENRVQRTITTFAAIDIPIERTERSLGEADVLGNEGPPGRVYLIALDFMGPENALRARFFLRQFIEKHFGPNDTAAVVLTTSGLSDSGAEFTSNPRLLLNAIDRFDGGTSTGDREKNFMGDFKELMRFMATLRGGRKAMIFVSGNIPGDPYMVVDQRPGPFGGMFSDVHPDFIEALSLATRNNIAIYPIDPAGLTTDLAAPGSFDTSALDARTNLGGLAEVTGGFALTNSNGYEAAFKRLVRENSTYYVLGFNSGEERRDGRYTRVEVRVKRPGLQVRSLDGYVAPRGRPQQLRRPPALLPAVWDAVASAITTSGVPIRVFAAPFRGRDKNAMVAITLEIGASKLDLVERDGAYRGVFEIVFALTDSKNKKWPLMRHRAEVAFKPQTYERVSQSGLRVVSQLPLPKGRYQLRVSAGGAALAGSVVYDLEVPDLRDDLSMSGIAFTSAEAREMFTASPYTRIDVVPWAPSTLRAFSREDTMTLFAEVYENRRKPHTVTFTAELRDETGRIIGSHVVERKAIDKPKESSIYTFAPNLILEDVPPGRYSVHVDVRSSLDKRKSLVRDIPISVR